MTLSTCTPHDTVCLGNNWLELLIVTAVGSRSYKQTLKDRNAEHIRGKQLVQLHVHMQASKHVCAVM